MHRKGHNTKSAEIMEPEAGRNSLYIWPNRPSSNSTSEGGTINSVDVPELTSERISSVVDMERPIASTPPPKSFKDFVFNPRQQVGAEIFRRGLVAEFLLRGLIRHCPDGSTIEWQLPEKGEAQEFEIDGISKFPSLPENGMLNITIC